MENIVLSIFFVLVKFEATQHPEHPATSLDISFSICSVYMVKRFYVIDLTYSAACHDRKVITTYPY